MAEVNIKYDQICALIVDDHAPIRKAMKRVLDGMGIKSIFESNDGEVAFTELSEHPVDLVLCDIYMRKVDGFEVVSYIRNRAVGADIPIIIVTGEASKDDIVKANALGADDYLLKPFKAEDLENKVKLVLSGFFSPSPLDKLLRYGDKLLMSKQYVDAACAYEEAKNIDPLSQRANHALAVTMNISGQKKEAKDLLRENIQASPTYYKNYATLADIFLAEDDLPKAIKFIRKELELNPKQPARQVQLGELL